ERERARVVRRGRALDPTARAQRLTWGRRGHGTSVTPFPQEAEWKDLRAACSASAALHRQVLQDVLARLERTSQECFRRRASAHTAGIPAGSGAPSRSLVPRQGGWHCCAARQGGSGSVQEWPACGALLTARGRRAQARDDVARPRWVGRL